MLKVNIPAAAAFCLRSSICACSSLISLCASSTPSVSTATVVPHDGQLCVVLASCTVRVDGAGSEGLCNSTDISSLELFYRAGNSALEAVVKTVGI